MSDFAVPILSILVIFLSVLIYSGDDKSLEIGEVFTATGGTSEYTCVISEADNDLSLNCLEGAK